MTPHTGHTCGKRKGHTETRSTHIWKWIHTASPTQGSPGRIKFFVWKRIKIATGATLFRTYYSSFYEFLNSPNLRRLNLNQRTTVNKLNTKCFWATLLGENGNRQRVVWPPAVANVLQAGGRVESNLLQAGGWLLRARRLFVPTSHSSIIARVVCPHFHDRIL